MKPTKYLRWSRRDRTMAEGLLEYEANLNPHGIPAWIAQDTDRVWDVDEVIDNVESAVGRAQKEYQGNEHVDPGLRLIPVEKVRRSGRPS